MNPPRLARPLLACWPLLLSACAVSVPAPDVAVTAPASWMTADPAQTALPHAGSPAQLQAWWQQWNDPVLLHLLDTAQQASPGVAAAATRVAQARHAVVSAGATGSLAVNAAAGAGRSVGQVNMPPLTQASSGLQVAWELDLFGGQQAAATAADQRLQASQAQWHEARVAVAAEVARQYVGWRSCQQMLRIARADAQARDTVARLTQDRARVGFESPANAALVQASAAQGRMLVTQQQAGCDATLQGLAAITAMDAAALKQQLQASSAPPVTAQLAAADQAGRANYPYASSANGIFSYEIPALPDNALPLVLPARLLAQRPDVWAAQRGVAAASADVGSAQADRYPRLGLSGQITAIGTRGAGGDGQTWSVGPLQLSLPLFDAGRRASQVQVQQAAYDEAVLAYRASVRTAVREVEQALLALHSTAARQADAAIATQGFARALQAATDRHRAGLGSLLELEDTRRSALAAEQALADLSRERLLAWVDLYRAYGGGWAQPAASISQASPSAHQSAASASAL